jgi:hypothetical protein
MRILYFTLVISKLEYTSVWNSIMSTDANKLESIQKTPAALCFNPFFPHVHCSYDYALVQFKLHTQCKRRHHLDTLFLIQVYLGSKFCTSLLETIGLGVPALHI